MYDLLKPLYRWLKTVAPFAALPVFLACVSQAPAQSAPTAPPQTPDLLGIYVGMPAAAAKAQLQKHSTAPITPNGDPASGFEMQITDPKNADQIQVWLTRAPNNPAVWMEVRTQIYYPSAGGPPLSFSAVEDALHQKYGTETVASDHPVSLVLYWIYDQSGKQLTTASAALQACDGGMYESYISMGPPQTLNDEQKACYAGFFAVKATLNRLTNNPQLLGSYNVQLVNLPYAYTAAMNTAGAAKAAAAKAQQDQINKAAQNKPAF
ncbi:MAG TPA: hypothetical protein VGG45_13550 [Terracidiphilus sp.]|jgi:hypothetical protein